MPRRKFQVVTSIRGPFMTWPLPAFQSSLLNSPHSSLHVHTLFLQCTHLMPLSYHLILNSSFQLCYLHMLKSISLSSLSLNISLSSSLLWSLPSLVASISVLLRLEHLSQIIKQSVVCQVTYLIWDTIFFLTGMEHWTKMSWRWLLVLVVSIYNYIFIGI